MPRLWYYLIMNKNPAFALYLLYLVNLAVSAALVFLVVFILLDGNYIISPAHKNFTPVLLTIGGYLLLIILSIPLLYISRNCTKRFQLLDDALNCSPDLVYIKDTQGNYLFANKAFCEMFGADQQLITTKADRDLMPEDLLSFLREQDNSVIRTRAPLRYENWLPRREEGGETEYYLRETIKSYFTDLNTGDISIIGIGRDITDQHRIKIALHKRERLLAALTKATQHILQSESSYSEAIPTALGMIGRECRAEAVMIFEEVSHTHPSTATYRMQYSWWRDNGQEEGFAEQDFTEELRPLLSNIHKKRAIAISGSGTPTPQQREFLDKSGMSSAMFASISFQGEHWGILCVATFLTPRVWSLAENAAIEIAAGQFAVILQRQQTEESLYRTFEALRQSQSSLGIALKAANAVPFEFDLLDGGVSIDPAFYTSLGYEAKWHAESLSDLLFMIHPGDQKLVRREIERIACGSTEPMSITARFRKARNDYAWFNIMGTPRFDENQPTSIIGLAQDITEKKLAENELLQTERMAAVGTLAAGVAHNFNNLNTGILGHLQMLRRKEELSERGRDKLDLVISTVERSITLTDSLLAFSGKRQGQRKKQLLAPLIQDTISLIFNEFGAEGISFTLQLSETAEAFCSAGEICHVLFNLLVNARHAMLECELKCITIACMQDGARSCITLSDTGCGIPEAKRQNIFIPFFTTKGEHASPGSKMAAVRGTGLGLSSSKSIIENHGGEIEFESEERKGTTFTIWLPVDELHTQSEDLPLKPEHQTA